MPGFANPQNLNRYSYVNNNPLRYTDPTGHMLDDGCATEGCNLTPLQKSIDAQKQKKHEAEAARRKCAKGNKNHCSGWNNWAWKNLPSAVGSHQGFTLQVGAGLEFSISAELSTVINWRSGQVTSFFTYDIGGYEGTPHGISLIRYGGLTSVNGASDNEYLRGPAAFVGGSASADAVGILGISVQRSQALDSSGTQFTDPVSKMPINVGQVSAVAGVNLTPNYVDIGVTAGQSNSFLLQQINLYDLFR